MTYFINSLCLNVAKKTSVLVFSFGVRNGLLTLMTGFALVFRGEEARKIHWLPESAHRLTPAPSQMFNSGLEMHHVAPLSILAWSPNLQILSINIQCQAKTTKNLWEIFSLCLSASPRYVWVQSYGTSIPDESQMFTVKTKFETTKKHILLFDPVLYLNFCSVALWSPSLPATINTNIADLQHKHF